MNRNTLPPIIYNNNNRQQYSENDNFSNSYQIMRSQTPLLDNQNSNNNNIISYQNMMKEIRELKLSLKNQLINQNELEKKLIDSYKLLSQQDNIIRLNASKINEHDLKITNVLNSFNNFLKIQEKTSNIINECQDKVNNKLLPVNIFTTFKSQILANNLSVKENLEKIISYNDNTELILQDLKNTEQNNLNLEQILLDMSPYELIDKCYIFAKFQSGCRFLQDYLTENANNNGIIKTFFEKVLEHIKELSKGQFSHYFVKKLLLFINEFQIMKLIKILSPMIEDISTNQYGTKVIQDIIDLIKTDKTYNLMLSIITPYIKQLIIDLNGTQIIFKLIVKSKDTKIIDDCICKNIKEIACSKKGSNFLIKYFEFAEEEDILNIKKNVLLNLKDIITDQFGNYVIQNILLKTNTEILQNFVDEIKNNIILYSNNKFASNAVEKCFQNDRIKNEVLKLFMSKDIFNKIILDKFGNYVAQKAIAAADDQDRKILIDLLKLTIPELKNKYFGEKLISKIQFLYPNFF